MNDKPLVIGTIAFLAVLASWAAIKLTSPELLAQLLEFFKLLASGLFGLVTGAAMERTRQYFANKKDEKQEVSK